jgi:hypothetical protein
VFNLIHHFEDRSAETSDVAFRREAFASSDDQLPLIDEGISAGRGA